MKCGVANCLSNDAYYTVGVSFFRFPLEEKLKAKWLKAIGREHWKPRRRDVICSLHFHPNQLMYSSSTRKPRPYEVPMILEPETPQMYSYRNKPYLKRGIDFTEDTISIKNNNFKENTPQIKARKAKANELAERPQTKKKPRFNELLEPTEIQEEKLDDSPKSGEVIEPILNELPEPTKEDKLASISEILIDSNNPVTYTRIVENVKFESSIVTNISSYEPKSKSPSCILPQTTIQKTPAIQKVQVVNAAENRVVPAIPSLSPVVKSPKYLNKIPNTAANTAITSKSQIPPVPAKQEHFSVSKDSSDRRSFTNLNTLNNPIVSPAPRVLNGLDTYKTAKKTYPAKIAPRLIAANSIKNSPSFSTIDPASISRILGNQELLKQGNIYYIEYVPYLEIESSEPFSDNDSDSDCTTDFADETLYDTDVVEDDTQRRNPPIHIVRFPEGHGENILGN